MSSSRALFLRRPGQRLRRELKPSARGETEIIDLIQRYLDWANSASNGWARLAWLDTGPTTPWSSRRFVRAIEARQG